MKSTRLDENTAHTVFLIHSVVLSLGSDSVFLGGFFVLLNVSRYIHGASISLHVNRSMPNVPSLQSLLLFSLSLSLSFYLKRPRSFGLQQHYCDFDFGSKVTFSEFIGDPKNIVNIMPRNVIGSLEFYNERLFNLNRGLTSFPFLQG